MAKKTKSKTELEILNETGKRKSTDRRKKKTKAEAIAAAPAVEGRTKTKRRRQIDPTTCEREYTDNEIEFMRAMDEYKRASGRMFPTCSEILEVLTNMGYRKTADAQALYSADTPEEAQTDENFDQLEDEFA